MTYKELIESIKMIDTELAYPAHAWLKDNGYPTHEDMTNDEDWVRLALEVASMAYGIGHIDSINKHIADNPRNWWVLDKNSEQVYIGDTVELSNGERVIVQGLSQDGIFAAPLGEGYIHFESDYFEKVIPDTRESITDDIANTFGIHHDEAEILYDRIADCVKAELGDA